jgi:hypothetical protein
VLYDLLLHLFPGLTIDAMSSLALLVENHKVILWIFGPAKYQCPISSLNTNIQTDYIMGFVHRKHVLGYQFVHRNKTFWFLHRSGIVWWQWVYPGSLYGDVCKPGNTKKQIIVNELIRPQAGVLLLKLHRVPLVLVILLVILRWGTRSPRRRIPDRVTSITL